MVLPFAAGFAERFLLRAAVAARPSGPDLPEQDSRKHMHISPLNARLCDAGRVTVRHAPIETVTQAGGGDARMMRREVGAMRRRARMPGGERRTETAPPVRWAPSERAVVERAAMLRGESMGAFVANSAVAVATGRMGPVRHGHARPVSSDEVAAVRELGRAMMDVRRLLANATGNLNQLTAAVNSGSDVPGAQVAEVLRYTREQIAAHDAALARLLNLLDGGRT